MMTENISDVNIIKSQPRTGRPHNVGIVRRRCRRLGVDDEGWGRIQWLSGATTKSVNSHSPIFNSHYLQYLTSLEGSSRKKNDRTRNVSRFNANHVWKFVVSEIWNFFCLIHPWIPYNGVGKIVFLYSHFSSRNYICYNMFLRGIPINSIRPFTYSNYVATFLIRCSFSSLK